MPSFGYFPGEALTTRPPPRGHFAAGVRIGHLNESVFSSTFRWSIEDYVSHWRHTASRYLRQPRTSWFCSSLDRRGCTCFIAFPSGDYCVFEEHLVPYRGLTVDGFDVVGRHPTAASSDVSSWRVELGDMQAYLGATG